MPSVMSLMWADRKRRVRCWFILARGATPSTAISTTRLATPAAAVAAAGGLCRQQM